jgi:hypothetical protein
MPFPLKRLRKYFTWSDENMKDLRKFIANYNNPSSNVFKGILKKKYSDLHFLDKL